MTIVPRTGPFSASSALAMTSWVPAREVLGLRSQNMSHPSYLFTGLLSFSWKRTPLP